MPQTATFTSPADGLALATYTWGADIAEPKAIVQIAHGLSEHAQRYGRFADLLVGAGYRVVAVDHRGHGRSATEALPLGSFDFPTLTNDISALGAQIVADNPGVPVFLFAHSMGSFAGQAVMLAHADQYAGVILTGSSAVDILAQQAMEAMQRGEDVGLESYNAAFEHRTGYEWLSRDEAEVDAYVADPLCGADATPESMGSVFALTADLSDDAKRAAIRSDLPLLIASGDADPLAGGGALIELLGQRYREAGLTDVTVKLYPGARHEIVNETNRDEVQADIINWLNAHV